MKLSAPRRLGARLIILIVPVAIVGVIVTAHVVLASSPDAATKLGNVERWGLTQPNGKKLTAYAQPGSPATVPLILVHGTPGDASAFGDMFREGIPGARLVTYDRPGFADSPGGRSAANLAYQTQTLLQLIDENFDRPVFLAGHSYGGAVVLNAALLAPDRIAGIILLAASVAPEMESLWWIQKPADWPIFSWILPPSLRACNREIIGLESDLEHMNTQLPNLRAPILAIQGEADPLVPAENAPLLRARLDKLGKSNLLTTRMEPGWNHFLIWNHTKEVNAAIAAFIEESQPTK